MNSNLSMQFLKACERAAATSSESPGANQGPNLTTSSKQIKTLSMPKVPIPEKVTKA